jgi:hypothetical protein
LEQWRRVRETYLRLAGGVRHGGPPRKLLEARLQRWEAQHKPTRLQRDSVLQRQVQRAQVSTLLSKKSQAVDDAALMRCLDRVLRRQARLAQAAAVSEQGAPKRVQHELRDGRVRRKRRA